MATEYDRALADYNRNLHSEAMRILTLNPGSNYDQAMELARTQALSGAPDASAYGVTGTSDAFGNITDKSANFDWGSNLAYDPSLMARQFNWQEYIAQNPDLAAAGIDTPWEAATHYSNYGKNENRPGVGFLQSQEAQGIDPFERSQLQQLFSTPTAASSFGGLTQGFGQGFAQPFSTPYTQSFSPSSFSLASPFSQGGMSQSFSQPFSQPFSQSFSQPFSQNIFDSIYQPYGSSSFGSFNSFSQPFSQSNFGMPFSGMTTFGGYGGMPQQSMGGNYYQPTQMNMGYASPSATMGGKGASGARKSTSMGGKGMSSGYDPYASQYGSYGMGYNTGAYSPFGGGYGFGAGSYNPSMGFGQVGLGYLPPQQQTVNDIFANQFMQQYYGGNFNFGGQQQNQMRQTPRNPFRGMRSQPQPQLPPANFNQNFLAQMNQPNMPSSNFGGGFDFGGLGGGSLFVPGFDSSFLYR
jgi:hypothetical protein